MRWQSLRGNIPTSFFSPHVISYLRIWHMWLDWNVRWAAMVFLLVKFCQSLVRCQSQICPNLEGPQCLGKTLVGRHMAHLSSRDCDIKEVWVYVFLILALNSQILHWIHRLWITPGCLRNFQSSQTSHVTDMDFKVYKNKNFQIQKKCEFNFVRLRNSQTIALNATGVW
jgi:hypothetical protein